MNYNFAKTILTIYFSQKSQKKIKKNQKTKTKQVYLFSFLVFGFFIL